MSAADEIKRAGRLAYREALPDRERGRAPVLLLHGFPETSYMWRQMLAVVTATGRRAIAPDLLGYGDSRPDPPATWERHVDALDEFVEALDPGPLVLVVHDWGGLIGLRWAVNNPERVAGLVISDSGFFPDGRWHGMAEALRTEGQGEQIVAAVDREALGQIITTDGAGFTEEAIDEYAKVLATPEGRAGILEMYRSGDFDKLEPERGKLAALGVPTLLLWGEEDRFAPVAGAYRFKKEIPHAELEIVPGAGHFVWSDEPERCAAALRRFLDRD